MNSNSISMDLRDLGSIMMSTTTSSSSTVVYYGLGLAFCAFFLLFKWNSLRYTRKGVPPGTMGWPIFGETSGFLKQGPKFMKAKRSRYKYIIYYCYVCLLYIIMSSTLTLSLKHRDEEMFLE